jgi:glycine/D-amino acid oxidase-like deaminating enzyme
MAGPDVAIIGGGIIGTAAAAFLAEAGASVRLFERSEIGAGASGRNSGAVQHPFDSVLYRLHAETLAHYRVLSTGDGTFSFPPLPAGLLLLADDLASAHRRVDELAIDFPELAPRVIERDSLQGEEPILAPGCLAIHLATGYPIPPMAAVQAFADRARRAGAALEIGRGARPEITADRVVGTLLDDGSRLPAGRLLVAAGPWAAELIDPTGGWQPLTRTYGVTVQMALPSPARHVLEEGVVHTVNRTLETPGEHAGAGSDPESRFSLVSAGAVTTLGSTFLPTAPEPDRVTPLLLSRGARFVPALREARILGVRVCARPQSIDGRPLIGAVPEIDGLFLATGHGPWGISTGPASARIVSDLILGRHPAIAPELAVDRFGFGP